MAFLIGTDEAGYGPNLGPLTVCGTSWETHATDVDLYAELSDVLCQKRDRSRLMVADSKAVYPSSCSIEKLETAVLAMLWACAGRLPKTWGELTEILNCENAPQDWMLDERKRLPLIADPVNIEQFKNRLINCFLENKISLVNCQMAVVFPKEFNELVDQLGNKAELLSEKTLGVVNNIIADTTGNVFIGCDKHGGRNKYLGMLSQYLTDEFVHVEQEGLHVSRYHWSDSKRSVQIQFAAKGEFFLPTALASMFAKYVREVAMEIWNDFWLLKLPGLKPTKGYPQDAKRFRKEIESVRQRLGISNDQIWRNR